MQRYLSFEILLKKQPILKDSYWINLHLQERKNSAIIKLQAFQLFKDLTIGQKLPLYIFYRKKNVLHQVCWFAALFRNGRRKHL